MTTWKPSDPYEINVKNRMGKVCRLRDYIKEKPKKYEAVFKYALDNWNDLEHRARYDVFGDNCVSIADQIQMYTNCPYVVAEDIAMSISISKAVTKR